MTKLPTSLPELSLVAPVPDRDAVFAFGWFNSAAGQDTLLKMGNAPDEIETSTLESERSTLEEFLTLEQEGRQKTWMMRYGEATIGAAWIDLVKNHDVEAPSIHLMVGDPTYRGKGIGKAAMTAMIDYLKDRGDSMIYSRHLVSNEAVTGLNRSLGFVPDGDAYTDENGLEWQNIKLLLNS